MKDKGDISKITLIKSLFSKNDFGWKILIGFIFWIILSMFLHFKEAKVDLLELDAKANKYVVAQIDFEFPDDESTIILKQESLSQVGTIYKINEKEIGTIRLEFEKFLVNDPEWRKLSFDYKKIYKIADGFENLLTEARFSNGSTIQKMKELNIDIKNFFNFSPSSKSDALILPEEYVRHFAHMISIILENEPEDLLTLVTEYFEKFKYPLSIDYQAQVKLRKIVEKSIPQKYTRIRAGELLIGQGDRVSARHVAMVQAMKNEISLSRKLFETLTIIGSLLLSFIFVFLSYLYLKIDQPKILKSAQKLSLIVCVVVITLLIAKLAEFVLLKSTSNFIEAIQYPIIVPVAALLLSVLLNVRIALFVAAFLSIIFGVTLAVKPAPFLIINLVTSLIVIIYAKSLSKRTQVFTVCSKCWLGVIPLLFAFNFIEGRIWTAATLSNIVSDLAFMVIIAIIVVGLLPILEAIFNVMTDITLMEYMDPNNELLRRLTIEIPGTYQHALVLGNLAESAAQNIGANGLLCRVAALFHDIGKLSNANYYTENQQVGGVNIHQLLTPIESAQVIISHVKDGEMLAKKYRFPQSFIDVIKEHHGTTLVYYFYCKELELKGGDKSKVEESLFRYPGPKPKSKESAILMIADGIEAASRSLQEISERSITEMVDKIVKDRADDGQFDESCLTFEELGKVKRNIIKTLLITQHIRIKYPDRIEDD